MIDSTKLHKYWKESVDIFVDSTDRSVTMVTLSNAEVSSPIIYGVLFLNR